MEAKGNLRKWMLALAVMSCLLFGTAVSCFAENRQMSLNGQWQYATLTKAMGYLDYDFNVPSDGDVTLTYWSDCYHTHWRIYEVHSGDVTVQHDENELWNASPTAPKNLVKNKTLSKGNYRVRVWSSNDNTGDQIKLMGTFKSGETTEIEPNDSFEQAMTLQRGKREKSIFTITDRIDIYKFNVAQTSQIALRVTSMVYEVYMTLYDRDWLKMNEYDIYWGNSESPKSYEATVTLTPGTYYVKMTPTSSNCGIYYLSYVDSAVSSITLNHSSLRLTQGEGGQLNATVYPTDAVNRNVKWSSSDPNVADVNESGKVYTRNCGQAVITAEAADGTGVKASCTVTVIPGKPSYLNTSASSAKKDSVQLNWGSVYGASGYRVLKYNTKTKQYEKYKDTSKTSMKVSKLAAETKYKFRVAAYIRIGSAIELGESSAVCSVYTAPKKISATKITSKKLVKKNSYSKTILLKWSKVSGATGYRVYMKSGSGSYYTYNTTKKTSMKISLSKGTTYRFKVVAYRTKHNLTTDASASKAVTYRS